MRHVLLGVRAVPPQLVDRTVARRQLLQRVGVVLVVLGSPRHVVEEAVPGGEVERGLGAQSTAGLDEVANHVSLSFSPRAVGHRVVGVGRGEQPSVLGG